MKNGKISTKFRTTWYKDNLLHRDDGPAVELITNTKEWWISGLRHRENGPAIEHADGAKEWWYEGKRHREDGPAVERPNGTKEWWVNDKWISEEEFGRWLDKKNLNEKLHATLPPKPIINRGKI